jgi:hypothetical protein
MKHVVVNLCMLLTAQLFLKYVRFFVVSFFSLNLEHFHVLIIDVVMWVPCTDVIGS